MAIKKSITTDNGFECPEAYIIVDRVLWQKGEKALVTCAIYKDQQAREENKPLVGRVNFTMAQELDADADNLVKQAYGELKQREDMSGAEDI